MGIFSKLFGSTPQAPPPDLDGMSREELYVEVFGPMAEVSHAKAQRCAHVVYRFDPREGRDYYTYVTGGMSAQEQPGMAGDKMARTELVFYSTAHSPLYTGLLRNFGHYPFETGSSFRGWDTVPLGAYAESVLGSDRFPVLWFCAGLRKEDLGIVPRLTAAGQTVYPMMIVPLTSPEFEFLREHGVEAFVQRIIASPVSVVFDPMRESVI